MKPNLSSTCLIQIAVFAARSSKKMGNRLSLHGISLTEYIILDFLNRLNEQTALRIELAEYMGMSPSGITRLLLPMEKNHLVEKVANPRDARQSLVKLSKTGLSVYQEAKVTFEQSSGDVFNRLSADEMSKMDSFFKKLL